MNATRDLEIPARSLHDKKEPSAPRRGSIRGQLVRFGMVGGLNTAIDLFILNGLLWLFPTQDSLLLLIYNSLAYITGAINSFFLNKYWTFGYRQKTSRGELLRFSATTLSGVACNNAIIWLASTYFHPRIANESLWANISKIIAICGTVLISFLGMRLWVFVHHSQKEKTMKEPSFQKPAGTSRDNTRPLQYGQALAAREQQNRGRGDDKHSLSIVLPAHNEEHVIASTITSVLEVASGLVRDFEVIVVNDGSTDQTGAIVASCAAKDARVRVIMHDVNRGYGAALVSGFHAASKQLTFFMDSDGQFDMRELAGFLPFIDEYDAVIGYRIDRQDTWMRKFNAWGWKQVVRLALGVRVRDIDCAFKLLHTDFLHEYPLETRGAMINAELLYKLTRSGRTYREVGVHHLPRLGGRATGARPEVIIRAFRELFTYAHKWKQEELTRQTQRITARV